MRGLYVELADDDRALLDRITADAGAAAGRPVRVKEVVEQLVRDAAARKSPVRVNAKPRRAV